MPIHDDRDCDEALAGAGQRGVLARGLGRSYGDAAQNAGGTVLAMAGGRGAVRLDGATGIVTAGAGVTVEALLHELGPRGWFVPVTPGTRHVTVGGLVAADVHGKNHHRDGSWMGHTLAITLASPQGDRTRLAPDTDVAAFWATAGGMGLTGVVTECTFQAVPISSSAMVVDTVRRPDLDAVMAAVVAAEARSRYAVAWIDPSARGRGVVTAADHAPAAGPLRHVPRPRLAAPPIRVIGPRSIRAFNEVWFRRAPVQRLGQLQSISAFFHPLDGVEDWNRLYGRRGFVQWQCVVPDGAEEVLRRVLERLDRAGAASFLTVLKRFGAGDPGPLSFPMPGWTLALDVPAAVEGLSTALDAADDAIVAAGGRLYLAKDCRMRPELLPVMYPRLDEWRAVRERLDPGRRLQSDLGRRLGLV